MWGTMSDSDLMRQPLAAIRAVQNQKIARQIALCARGSAFYQKHWSAAGIDAGAVHTLADLEHLPLTPKSALMADPEAFRLHCPDLPLHERALWEVNYTTGSTGDPTPLYVTTHDYQAYLFQARRVAEISGVTDRDMLANLFPAHRGADGCVRALRLQRLCIGCCDRRRTHRGETRQLPLVQRSLDEAVAMVERHHATILWGVTSYVRRVIMRAAELHADFTSVRMCGVTGEASTPAMREDMRQRLRALGARGTVIFDRYGSTELGGLAQCREEGDWHNPAPELLFHEVVDPDTGRRLPDGERGALAITHLDRRGTTLIRYLVGDIVSLSHEPCPHCGRSGDRIVGPVIRTKDLLKVKGMLINPAVLFDAIRRVPGVDEFQVVNCTGNPSDPFSMDEIILVSLRQQRTAMAWRKRWWSRRRQPFRSDPAWCSSGAGHLRFRCAGQGGATGGSAMSGGLNFGFTPEQEALRDTVHRFAKRELTPEWLRELDRTGAAPHAEIIPKMAALGFTGIVIPTAFGGVGGSAFDADRAAGGTGPHVTCRRLVAEFRHRLRRVRTDPVRHAGTKQFYLPRIVAGTALFAFALTEPNAGSDAASVRTRARLDGDAFVINGSKQFITGAAEDTLSAGGNPQPSGCGQATRHQSAARRFQGAGHFLSSDREAGHARLRRPVRDRLR